jgi:DNA-binding HxlR family transcriptional regulator
VFSSPTATFEVVGNTGNPSSEKAGVGGSTPSLATIILKNLAESRLALPVRSQSALYGIRRFSDFQKSLGLAKNVLSARLKKLVVCGIMEQVPASDGSAYQEYALTQKGRDLFPVIVALRQWGEGHLFSRGEKRLQLLDKRTGKPFRVKVQNAKGEILTANDLELVTVKN